EQDPPEVEAGLPLPEVRGLGQPQLGLVEVLAPVIGQPEPIRRPRVPFPRPALDLRDVVHSGSVPEGPPFPCGRAAVGKPAPGENGPPGRWEVRLPSPPPQQRPWENRAERGGSRGRSGFPGERRKPRTDPPGASKWVHHQGLEPRTR